jgi:glycine/D-amino acid oxidase-like deaminating enzyme
VKRLYDPSVRGSTEPWWTVEAPPDPPEAALSGEVRADAVVVGGGLTGLWTALALRERSPGLDVVVLEAMRCGDGASSRNGGFLHGYRSSLARLVDVFGREGALEVARSCDGVVDAVRALGEDVWLRDSGMLLVSSAPAHDAQLRREVDAAGALGLAGEAVELGRDEVPFRSPLPRGAIRYRDGATVQPARLVRALRRAALRAGVRLYEGSPVVELAPGRVRTAAGSVRADEVVLATNAWATRVAPAARRLAVFRSAIVLTAPVDDLEARLGWAGAEPVYDGRTYLSYFRTTADGRVLMGSASGRVERAERALRAFFPGLADVAVEHAWEGAIDVSSDRFPFFATIPGTRVHYGAGYTGNGVGPSWLGGRLLASLVLGEPVSSPLVHRAPARLPPEPLRTLGARVVGRALLAIDDAEAAGRPPPPAARAVAALPRALGLRIASR